MTRDLTSRTPSSWPLAGRRAAALLLPLALAVAVGCGSSSPKTTPPTTPGTPITSATTTTGASTAQLCTDVTALKQTVTSLTDLPLNKDLPSAASAQVNTIKQQVDKLTTDAQGQYGPQVDQVKAASTTLDTSLSAARQSPSASTLKAVASAATGLATAVQNLQKAIPNGC